MWPITGKEVVLASGGTCALESLENIIINGASCNSKKVKIQELFVAIDGEKFDGHDFVEESISKGAALALVNKDSPKIAKLSSKAKKHCIMVDDVLESFRNIATFLRNRFSFPVIGIGGSNGKTTTKELLAAMLAGGDYLVTKTEKSENGFLGLAVTLTQEAHKISNAPNALVLEIGIDTVGAMEQHIAIGNPDLVLLTALGVEHLSGLKNLETAVFEELKLFRNSYASKRIWQANDPNIVKYLHEIKENDVVVCESTVGEFKTEIGVLTRADFEKRKVSMLTYSVPEADSITSNVAFVWYPASDSRSGYNYHWKGSLLLNLPGQHNAGNMALAVAAALSLGRTPREIEAGYKIFVQPPMRSRIVPLNNKSVLYDDCYNSNPTSLVAALEVLLRKNWEPRKKVLVLGDMLDLGEESKKWHLSLIGILQSFKNASLCFYGSAMYHVYNEMLKDKEIVERNNNSLSFLSQDSDPCTFFCDFDGCIDCGLDDSVILIKGSRGMDLGRVVAYLEKSFS